MLQQSDVGFPETRWSLIDAIVRGDPAQQRSAMQMLAKTYWPAIYASLRQRGIARNEAEELTQAFFSEVIMGRHLFEQADANRGSLRNLLLVALKRFLIDQHRRKVKPVITLHLPMEEVFQEDQALQQDSSLDPDVLFDRRWALAVLQEALRRCEKHFQSCGKERHWAAFELRIVKPALAMGVPPSHEHIANELSLEDSEESVAAVRVVRKRLIALLRQVVAETTHDVDDQEVEYQGVVALLS